MTELFTILSEIVNFFLVLGVLSLALDQSRTKRELREIKRILRKGMKIKKLISKRYKLFIYFPTAS